MAAVWRTGRPAFPISPLMSFRIKGATQPPPSIIIMLLRRGTPPSHHRDNNASVAITLLVAVAPSKFTGSSSSMLSCFTDPPRPGARAAATPGHVFITCWLLQPGQDGKAPTSAMQQDRDDDLCQASSSTYHDSVTSTPSCAIPSWNTCHSSRWGIVVMIVPSVGAGCRWLIEWGDWWITGAWPAGAGGQSRSCQPQVTSAACRHHPGAASRTTPESEQ